jgi:hypothetical protein
MDDIVHRQNDVAGEQRTNRGKHDRNRQRQPDELELGKHKPVERGKLRLDGVGGDVLGKRCKRLPRLMRLDDQCLVVGLRCGTAAGYNFRRLIRCSGFYHAAPRYSGRAANAAKGLILLLGTDLQIGAQASTSNVVWIRDLLTNVRMSPKDGSAFRHRQA